MDIVQIDGVNHVVRGTSDGKLRTYCYKKTSNSPTYNYGPNMVVCPKCTAQMFYEIEQIQADKKNFDNVKYMMNSFHDILDHVIRAQHDRDTYVEAIEHKEGSYPFIPLSLNRQIMGMKDLREHLRKERRWSGHKYLMNSKFLDAGCGIGNAMLAANTAGLCANQHGIEYFPETADKAEQFLGIKNGRYKQFKVLRDDILKFKTYNRYDIVYFYCPFSDRRLQVRFEEYLEDNMKIGAVLMGFMKQGHQIRKDERFEQIKLRNAEAVFIKVKGGKREKSEVEITDRRYGYRQQDHIIKEKYNLST
jgi:SAM-dependent methyltransferase